MNPTIRRPNMILVLALVLFSAVPVLLYAQQPANGNKPKHLLRMEWFYSQREDASGAIPVQTYHAERQRAVEMQKIDRERDMQRKMAVPSPAPPLTWAPIGPGTVSNNWPSHWGNTSGRVRAVAVHPTDPNTLYIGAAAGGVWKSTNAGASWADVGFDFASLTFGAIAIDPGNPNVVYAGSGEARYMYNNVTYGGEGLYKSTNAGVSWTNITDGFGDYTHFSDIEVSPHNSNIVLATLSAGYWYAGVPSNMGVWRSTDAGTTWTRTAAVSYVFDIVIHPTDANIMYAAATGGLMRSTDAGASWLPYGLGLPPGASIRRMHLSIAQSSPSIMYAVIYNDTTTMNTSSWKSTDGGANWSQISAGVQLGGNYGSSWNDQGGYDLCIAASPTDPNRVFIGNIEMHRTTNGTDFSPLRVAPGGGAWQCPIHVDIHTYAFAPSNSSILYAGCDGGIYRSSDAGNTWTSVNGTLPTIQLYRISSHPTSRDIVVGGAQDNGNFLKNSSGTGAWNFLSTGDGMVSMFDYNNPSTIYFTTQRGSLYKSTNGGVTYSKLIEIGGAWVTPFVMHPTTPTTLYSATMDFKRSIDGGVNWSNVSTSVMPGNVQAIAISPVTAANIIIAGAGDYNSSPPVKISTDGGATWTLVTANIPGSQRYISAVEADPHNGSTFYAVRSGFSAANKVYKTTNLGATWTNISGDLPNVPHSALFLDPDNAGHYYVGNDLGVYRTTDDGTTWVHESNGMPIVPVIDFAYSEIGSERILRAATHGRSVFEVNIGAPCLVPSITIHPSNTTVCAGINAQFTAAASGSAPMDITWERSPNGSTWTVILGATSATLTIPTADTLDGWRYRAVFTNACGTETSAPAVVTVNTVPAIATHPTDENVCEFEMAAFSVAGTGSPAPTIQWQRSPDGSVWSPIPGEMGNTLSFAAASSDNNARFRALLTNLCGSATTNVAMLTVESGPAITAHPADKTVCDGSSATFSVVCPAATSYQWQRSSDGLAFGDIAGETGSSLSFIAQPADDGFYYRAVVTNGCGSVSSNAAQLTVNTSVSIVQHPQNIALCDSGWVRLVAKAGGSPVPTVQWEQSSDGVNWSTILTASDTAYVFYADALYNGMMYRALFTASCGLITSNTAALSVGTVATVAAHPVEATICEGDTAYFSISGSGTISSVSWQERPIGGSWSDIVGGMGFNLHMAGPTIADDSTEVRAIVNNSCGSDTSNAALLLVTPSVTVVQQPLSFTVCDGTMVMFRASASGAYTSVSWEYSSDGTVYQTVTGATDTALTVTAQFSESGFRYRAVFTGGCAEQKSHFGTLTVNMPPTITDQPQDETVCTGTDALFSVAASGSPAPSILWFESLDGTSWNALLGETTATLRVAVTPQHDGRQYRAVAVNHCSADTSAVADLSVSVGFSVAASDDAAACIGVSVPLDVTVAGRASPFNYHWSPLPGLSDPEVKNPIARPVATTVYTVTVTDANGCVAEDSVTVTVHSKPIAHAGADAVVCAGKGVSIGAPATGGTAPYTYSWSPSTGLTADTAMLPIASPISPTVYTLTVTDANGCTAIDQVLVDVNPAPEVDAGESRIVCAGSNTTIGKNASGGTAPYTYHWSPVAGLDVTNVASPLASPVSTTTYFVTATDALGCVAIDSVTLTVRPRPIADAGRDSAVCKGVAVPLGAPATGGTPPYSYMWTPTTGLSDANIAQPIATPFTSTSYKLTVIDAAGCTASDNVMVAIFSAPVAFAGSDATVCAGQDVIIGNNAIGGTKPYAYVWTPATGLSDPKAARPVASPTVTTTYTVTVTDSAGCVATDEMAVTVRPQPTIEVGSDKTICKGGSTTIGAAATGGTSPYHYAWFPSAGLSDPHSATPVASPVVSTAYTVFVTDAAGCTTEDQVRVEIAAIPEPSIYSDRATALCKGERVTLAVSDPYAAYTWSNGATTPTITVDSPGEYYVIVSNSFGCRDTSQPITVTVNPLPKPFIYGPSAVCPDTQATYFVSDELDVAYEWSIAGGQILSSGFGASVRVQWTETGGGLLTVRAVSLLTGCVKDSTMFVQVSPTFQPVVTVSGPLRFCQGGFVALDAGPGYESYLWSNGETKQKIVVTTSGDFTVKVSLPSGCSGTSAPVRVEVIPAPRPTVTASGPLTFCEGESVTLDAGAGYTAYEWNTGATTRTLTVNSSGTYSVTVTHPTGCQTPSVGIAVAVKKAPPIDIVGPNTACQGSTVWYQAPRGAGFGYTWTVQGGYIPGRNDSSAVGVVWQSSGFGNVDLEMNLSGYCSVFADLRVQVYPMEAPVVSPAGPVVVCKGTPVVLTAPAGQKSYFWNTYDSTRVITVTKAGEYWVEVISPEGCKRRSAHVKVLTVDYPAFLVDGPVRIRPGQEATFKAPANQGYSYRWSTVGGTIISGAAGPEFKAVFPNEGPASVTVIATNTTGCSSTFVHTVEVTEDYFPEVTILGSSTICEGETVTLRGPDEARTYTWSNGETTQDITIAVPGRYAVTVTDKYGFLWHSKPVDIFVIPTPEPTITLYGPPEICEGETLVLEAPEGYASYSWSDGSGGRRAYVSTGGTYWVTVTNAYGCSGTSVPVVVRSRPSPAVPVIVQKGARLITDEALWYQWYRDGKLIPQGTERELFTDTDGIYTVRVGGENGCSRLSEPYTFTVIMTEVNVPLVIEGEPGNLVQIPIIFQTENDLAKATSMSFSVTISFAPNVLTPLNAPYYDRNGLRYATLTGSIKQVYTEPDSKELGKAGEDVQIAVFECMAMLGTADSTIVRIEYIDYADYRIGAYTSNGVFRLGICREGGDRLFDDQGQIALEQNRPNPFNTTTIVEYEIIERGPTKLYVMDMLGRRVKTLVDERMEPGRYSLTVDLGDVPTGTYMYVLHTPTQIRYKLMELVK